jgi:23S rRNA pseudouridine2605 synthase
MRLNKYVAQASKLSRRGADDAITFGEVLVNGEKPNLGHNVVEGDIVELKGEVIRPVEEMTTILLNKPAGLICSKDGQGSRTIYSILPSSMQHLNPVGRLDKDSTGLLLLTNDGGLVNKLAHPSNEKLKVYEIELNKALRPHDQRQIEQGLMLADGKSALKLKGRDKNWQVTMHEGRNRQIRRTFAAVYYRVTKLHRTKLGKYELGNIAPGKFDQIKV